jgi:hypothetical protein
MWNQPVNVSLVNKSQRQEWFQPPFGTVESVPELVKWRESKQRKLLDDSWAAPNQRVALQRHQHRIPGLRRPNCHALRVLKTAGADFEGEWVKCMKFGQTSHLRLTLWEVLLETRSCLTRHRPNQMPVRVPYFYFLSCIRHVCLVSNAKLTCSKIRTWLRSLYKTCWRMPLIIIINNIITSSYL